MTGTIRILLATMALIAAGYGIAYVWTGELPPYALEIGATFGVFLVLAIIITVITKPAGEKH